MDTKYNPKQIVAIRPEKKLASERFRYVPEKVTKNWRGRETVHPEHFVDDRLFGDGSCTDLPDKYYLEGDTVYVRPHFIVFWTDKTTTTFHFKDEFDMRTEFVRLSREAGLMKMGQKKGVTTNRISHGQ